MSAEQQGRRGFTLVELLVVLAVLGVLAAILFPALAGARERGRQTVCLSNERQIGVAFEMYLNDWERVYPPPVDADNWTPFWRERLLAYLRTPDVLRCPDNPNADPLAYPVRWTDAQVARLRCPLGYAMNGVAFATEGGWSEQGGMLDGRPASDFKDPAGTILVGDTRYHWSIVLPQFASPILTALPDPRREALGLAPGQHLLLSHLGRLNWLFCDGHVRALKLSQTFLPQNLWRATSHDPSVADGNVQYLTRDQMAPEYW